jgi:hypothetical protein
MNINKPQSAPHPVSGDRPVFEKDIDAYKAKGKLPEPTVCLECGAVYHEGRWQWIHAPVNAHHETCPACHRVHDNFPAGFVTLKGSFFDAHSEEIKKIIQHHAEHERAEHPLKRIIAIDNQDSAMLVTTTDTHLARGIGEAVHNAYQG